MKKLVVILVMCLGIKGMSQSNYGNNGRIDNIGVNDFGNGMWVKSSNQKSDVKGSPYLYDTWFNNGIIFLNDNKISMKSFNYNIKLERFESKISEDSIFAVNPRGIIKVEIRGNEFIRALDPEFQRNSYFQKIAVINDKMLLEKHILEFKEGQINPMTMKKMQKDALIQKQIFYLADDNGEILKRFKMRKNSVLGLIDKKKVSRVKEFAKQNKLKFKITKDVKVLLEYAKAI